MKAMEKFGGIPEVVKVSSKGQFVIPQEIRELRNIKAGSVFSVMSPSKDTVVLKRIKNPVTAEDLEMLKDVEEAWKEIERGEYTESTVEEFLEELKEW